RRSTCRAPHPWLRSPRAARRSHRAAPCRAAGDRGVWVARDDALDESSFNRPPPFYPSFSRSLSNRRRSAVLLCSSAISDAAAECVGGPTRRLLHFGGSLAGKLASDALSTSSRGVSSRALG